MSSLIRTVIMAFNHFSRLGIHPAAFVLGMSVILCPVAARADVVADANAPASQRPTILDAGNGVPVVNIRTPSAAGVSRNTYSEFNVDANGVILNNGRTDSSTQLGGWVQANPWLATGSARVILNEVNASDPSRLNGFVEVAGSRAQVVIANPAGISCEGCGFINASRATLSTGTPIVNNGQLQGYDVAQGRVEIGGAGLDNSTGYTDLIAHAVDVNAGIWSQQLAVAAGGGTVNADVSAVSSNGSSAPAVAIDVAHLGGMYANSIRLIGTEAGVGVRNAGQIGIGAGDVTLTADGRIENAGVINGGNTRLNADALDNTASGRIYGDHVAVGADTVDNIGAGDAASVIAARERLDIGATTLNNREHGLLFSGGDLAIGGVLDESGNASGQAGTLNNASASVEALDNMNLSVRQINNTDEHLQVADVLIDAERVREFRGDGAQNRYSRDEVGFVRHDQSRDLRTPEDTYRVWYEYNYTHTVHETQVLEADPARIVAGGDLQLTTDLLNNSNSQVLAGGTLGGDVGNIVNTSAEFRTIDASHGEVTRYRRVEEDDAAGTKSHWEQRSSTSGYHPVDITLQPERSLAIVQSGANLPAGTLPDSSLYTANPNAPRGYLIETDPQFANYRQWISSDYMLQQLAFDPALTQMRLGDGFYEQQLVREQMAQLTGRRFLSDFSDDEAQYIALMDAGVTFAQAHNIRPGIALTAEQIAQLTSDIVWLVEEQRTLPDGSTANVLVPRLYVMVREGGINGSGGLIAADTLQLDMSGDLDNSGTVAGHRITALTADNIHNVRGTLAGADVQLQARQDINSIGGSIRAQDNLQLDAGNDINVISSTRSDSNQQGTRTYIDRVAGLYVNSGSLLANAGNNINLTGAAIVNDSLVLDADRLGNTVLTAGNDFILNSVQESETQRIVWSDGGALAVSSAQDSGTQIRTSSDLTLQAGRDLNGSATRINSQGNVELSAGNDLTLAAGRSTYSESDYASDFRTETQVTRHNLVEINSAGDNGLHAGNDLVLTGSQLTSTGSTRLSAQGDTTITAVVDKEYHYDYHKTDRSYGRSEKTTDETLSSTVVGGTLASSGEILINAHKTEDGRIIGSQSRNVTLTGTQLHSGGDIVVSADGDINISALQYNTLEYHQTQTSGTGGLSKSDEGSTSVESRLQNAVLASAGNTHILSGNNLSLIAADVVADGDINLEALDQLLIAAGQVLTQHDQWMQESDTFSSGNLYEMREQRAGESVSSAQASTLIAGGSVTARAGTGRIIGSDIHGEQGVNLQADAGDFSVEAAQNTHSSYFYDKEITVGLGDSVIKGAINPALLVQVNDGRATVHIADAHYLEDQSTSHDTWMRGTNISSGNDIDIRANAGNVNIIGSHLAADANDDGSGDVNLSAAHQINIVEATDTARSNSQHISGDAEVSLVVQHQAVEVVKAYERLVEAKEQLEEAKRQYKDYERNLDQLKQSLRQLEQDLADKKPGVNQADLVELRGLIEDVESDKEWYVAGIALASLNLVSASNALATQIVALSASGQTLGFNAGLQLDIDASQTQSEYQSTTAVASTVSGQNIRINTGNGNTENTTTNIRGSQLLASNNIAITTGDLNITASKNTAQSSSETQHGHITAQMTVYGAAGGASVNASFDRNQNSAKETTYNNSVLLADSIDLITSGDTTLRGATVRAESTLNADIGGDLTVESVQDRSSSRNSSAGVSGGFSLGGDGDANQGNAFTRNLQSANDIGSLSGLNVGANTGNGVSDSRQTVLTSLTSGGTANINVNNHTQITGALIATTDENGNDLNQLNLNTNTISFADLRDRNVSSQTSAGLSVNFNMQPVNPPGQASSTPSPAAQSASQPAVATGANGEELKPGTTNIVYNNSQQNSASNAMATLGHGTITVGGTVLEQNGELTGAGKAEGSALAGINRDTTDTKNELWSSDYSQELDVTIDNRLLDPNRWDEFGQDYVNATNVSKEMFNAAVDEVQQFRRELAAMGQDLPEHLGQLLGERGEQFVDELIRAGLSDETIERILADDRITASLLGLSDAIERCTSQEVCTAAPERKPQTNSLNQQENADNLIEIVDQRSPLQIGVQSLGYLYGELQQLAIIDPQAARALELAIRTFTGGPFKVALSEASSALTAYVLSNTYGEAIDRQVHELMLFASSKVQGTDVEQFTNGLVWEKNNLTQGEIADFGGNNLTLDGIRLSGFIIGAMGSVVGSGNGSSNRVAGNGGRGGDGSGGSVANGDVSASTPVGRTGSWTETSQFTGNPVKANRELNVAGAEAGKPPVNAPATIGSREYSGHALDRMQQRGYVPSVVEDAIQNGARTPSYGGASSYYSSSNNVTVIINDSTGKVVTVRGGR
jgi:filamentous hemagglutinin family protein